MKLSVKVFSAAAVFLFGILYLLPGYAFAKSNSDQGGMKDLKTEPKRQGQIFQNQQETELERIAPNLFKEKTDEAIKAKQAEEMKAKAKIFTAADSSDSEFKEMEKLLFSRGYKAKNAGTSQKSDPVNVKKILIYTAIGAVIAAACAGIYAILPRWFGVKEKR